MANIGTLEESVDRIERDLLTEWAPYGPRTANDIRELIGRLRSRGIRSLTLDEVADLTEDVTPLLLRNIRDRA